MGDKTPNFEKLYNVAKEQLANSEKERLAMQEQLTELKKGVEIVRQVTNGNLEGAKGALIHVLKVLEDSKLVWTAKPAQPEGKAN